MTSVSSRSHSRDSSPDRRSSRSRSVSHRHSPGSDFDRSCSHCSDRSRTRSHSNSRSNSRSHSRSRSRSHYSRSHSHSRSGSKRSRSRSWSRSRSGHHRSYFSHSHSRSRTRSRSSSYRDGRRRSYPHSSSRSRSPGSSERSHSRSAGSPHSLIGSKYARDRSKRLKWNNAIWLVGEKAKDVVFHFCDVCDLPVVIYGRLLPCKHVLCFNCAAKLPNKCNRCNKTIQTIERCLVGGIFMCFESDGCRRTYLSQRDLQAHIDHRHKGSAKAKNDIHPTGSTIPSVVLSKNKLEDPVRGEHQFKTSHVMPQKKLLPTPISVPQQMKNPSAGNPSSITSSQSSTSCFPSTGKPMGLLPLPTQPAPQAAALTGSRLPLSVNHPLRLRGLAPFPTLSQFSTPPPGGARNITPLAVMNPSIPPPSLPTPSGPPPSGPSGSASSSLGSQQQQQAQAFGNASALAALAAALNVQSKASNLTSRPDNVLASAGSLQTSGINLSLISNVLRTASAAWTQAGAHLPNLPNIAQQANLQAPNQLLNNRSGGLNMRRFPP
ncbi:E3 ubiquitin-protein ligase Hakai [Fasciola hepatica]|uniref:E3 ubiquitin-protein ligase Hakai n=1 Tax=Fasciola hepatica TaxID=6192 RepID=A0A4E0RSN0_FASHE|nr:E3 ubiquitin-protein ligase Hakai [Fasciola hepatica]